ncbi:MAG: lytic transglycosylase domain-containing protein [Spirochaetes bacterium]|nr:lytic transglycosylase domain-containing protein [Spirochaetota bacterium]
MRYAFLTTFVLLVACSQELPAEYLSELGFYSKPADIISRIQGKAVGPAEHFLLARAYLESKEYRLAVRHFANSSFRYHFDPNLRHYPIPVYRFVKGFHIKSKFFPDAAFELAKLYAMYREHEYVVKFADMVPDDGSALYRDAMIVKSQSLMSLNRRDRAMGCLRDLLKSYRDPKSASLIHIRIASLFETAGDKAGAVREYCDAIAQNEPGWQAVISANKIVALTEGESARFSPGDALMIAGALYRGRKYREAIGFIDGIDGAPGGVERDILLVRCLTRSGDAARLRAVRGGANRGPALEKAHADELWRMGRKGEAATLYRAIASSGAEPEARESLQRLASHMAEKRVPGFRDALAEYAERYRKDQASAEFLWLLGRDDINGDRREDALAHLTESLKRFPESFSSDNCRFWIYKLMLEKGDRESAMKAAAAMAFYNPNSAYTWRLAAQMAGQTPLDDLKTAFRNASGEMVALYHLLLFVKEKDMAARNGRIGRVGHPKQGAYRDFARTFVSFAPGRGSKLKGMERYFETGYLEGIYREIQLVPRDPDSRRELYEALAYFGYRYGYPHLGVYAAIELQRLNSLNENIACMPEDAVKALLPRPFARCVGESAGRFKVESNMIYSLIKAESLFNHAAVSSAGAVGLMQLMPGTARGIARDLSIPKGYDLKEPCTSILMGTQYISWLREYLNNNFEYMVAGYNGGAGNVQRWKKKLNAPDMDYFTEFVPFEETRFYILRTGKFLEQYRAVYGDDR